MLVLLGLNNYHPEVCSSNSLEKSSSHLLIAARKHTNIACLTVQDGKFWISKNE